MCGGEDREIFDVQISDVQMFNGKINLLVIYKPDESFIRNFPHLKSAHFKSKINPIMVILVSISALMEELIIKLKDEKESSFIKNLLTKDYKYSSAKFYLTGQDDFGILTSY